MAAASGWVAVRQSLSNEQVEPSMAQHHGVAESERQVDETVGGGVMEWTHGQVTLGILERRLTARSNRRGELSQSSSGHIRRDLELMSTLRGVEQGVCSGYLPPTCKRWSNLSRKVSLTM